MRYRTSLEIGIGQTQASPAWTVLNLEHGYITEVEVMFPAGHAGLTYVQIYHQTRQIFPLTPSQAFRGDDSTITFEPKFPLLEVPYAVYVVGWAPEATLKHTVFVDITMEAPQPVFVGGFEYIPLPEGV